MKRLALLALLGAFVAGCGPAGDVGANDVRSKEQQIEEATKKLNAGKSMPPQDQQ